MACPATRGHGINQAQAAAEDNIRVHCPTAADICNLFAEGYADAEGMGQHLRPCWCRRVTLPPVPYRLAWPALLPWTVLTSGPKLQLRAMSESTALLQSGSVLRSMVPAATVRGLGRQLGPCWSLGTIPLLGVCQSERPALPCC